MEPITAVWLRITGTKDMLYIILHILFLPRKGDKTHGGAGATVTLTMPLLLLQVDQELKQNPYSSPCVLSAFSMFPPDSDGR